MLELFVEVGRAAGSALGTLLPYLLGLAAVTLLVVARAGTVLQRHRPAPAPCAAPGEGRDAVPLAA